MPRCRRNSYMPHTEAVLDLSVIIVSFNTMGLLRNCLRSVLDSVKGISSEVFVVDNASHDGSPEMVKRDFPEVKLIENVTNTGFAKANNLALLEATGRYILLLNSDTVMPECPRQVIEYMDAKADIGLLGCRIVFGDGSLQYSAWRFPTLFQEWYYFSFDIIRIFIPAISRLKYRGIDYGHIADTDCVSGCSLFINGKLINLIGGFDEQFFMYYEDSEYCYRTTNNTNYRVVYFPYFQVIHYHGKSSNPQKATLRSFMAARYYFAKTKGARFSAVFVTACRMIWRFNLTILSIIQLFFRNIKVAGKIDMFRQLLSSVSLSSKEETENHETRADKFPASGCKYP